MQNKNQMSQATLIIVSLAIFVLFLAPPLGALLLIIAVVHQRRYKSPAYKAAYAKAVAKQERERAAAVKWLCS